MTIKELCEQSHKLAKEKGWYDEERSFLEFCALFHSEISEAVEEERKGNPRIYQRPEWLKEDGGAGYIIPLNSNWDNSVKPEGVLIELADVFIRIADMCEHNGWDLEEAIRLKHEYNKTRPDRHGGKKY